MGSGAFALVVSDRDTPGRPAAGSVSLTYESTGLLYIHAFFAHVELNGSVPHGARITSRSLHLLSHIVGADYAYRPTVTLPGRQPPVHSAVHVLSTFRGNHELAFSVGTNQQADRVSA